MSHPEITRPMSQMTITGTVGRQAAKYLPDVYILTESGGVITGLAPGEQAFIEAQPVGTKVILVRQMFATSPEPAVDPGRGN